MRIGSGATIVSASWDKTLETWDAASGWRQATLEGHSDFVCAVDWSFDATCSLAQAVTGRSAFGMWARARSSSNSLGTAIRTTHSAVIVLQVRVKSVLLYLKCVFSLVHCTRKKSAGLHCLWCCQPLGQGVRVCAEWRDSRVSILGQHHQDLGGDLGHVPGDAGMPQ
jgi:WD40 repeat protein